MTTKARRILRRTLTGGTLALTVAGILWWNHGSRDGRPILYVTSAVLVAAVWETSCMGALAPRSLLPVLLVSAAGAIAWAAAGAREALPRTDLALAYAWAGLFAAAAYGLLRGIERLAPGRGSAPRAVAYLVFGTIIYFVATDPADYEAAWIALAILAVTCVLPLLFQPGGTRSLAIAVGLAVWLVPPLPALWQVWREWATSGLVALLLCAKIGDTAGYYVGNAIGRRHPFPKISPGKTVEGCLGSFAAGTAAGAIAVGCGLLPGTLLGGLGAGAIVNLAAQGGDLLESWVKRRAGVKDSSTVFGPSGGLLDQIDSLLLAVPVAVATWPWLLRAPSP